MLGEGAVGDLPIKRVRIEHPARPQDKLETYRTGSHRVELEAAPSSSQRPLVSMCFSLLQSWALQGKGSWFQRDTVRVPLRSKPWQPSEGILGQGSAGEKSPS